MRRFIGLLLIIRGLAPVLAVAVIVWGLGDMTGALHRAMQEPVAAIQAEIDTVRDTIDTARQQFDDLKEDLATLTRTLTRFRVPDFLPDLPNSLSLPSLNIPDVNITYPTGVSVTWTDVSGSISELVPNDCGIFDFLCDAFRTVTRAVSISYPSGVSVSTGSFTLRIPDVPNISIPIPNVFGAIRSGLAGLFSGFDGLFDLFDGAFSSLRGLGDDLAAVTDQLGEAFGEARSLVSGVRDVLLKWGGVIVAAAVIVLALVAIGYVASFLQDITRGLRMLFQPPPEPDPLGGG